MQPIYEVICYIKDTTALVTHAINLNQVSHAYKRDDTPRSFVVELAGGWHIEMVFRSKEERDEEFSLFVHALAGSDAADMGDQNGQVGDA